MAKREQTAVTASIEISDNVGVIELTFANGRKLKLATNDLAFPVVMQCTMHGLKQKLVDAAAISRNPETGASATVEDKFRAVEAVYNRLLAGEWNAKRGEGGTGAGGLLFRALVRLYPAKTSAQLRDYLDGLDKAKQAALRKNPKIAAIIEEIKAEDGAEAEGIDSDELLAGLEG